MQNRIDLPVTEVYFFVVTLDAGRSQSMCGVIVVDAGRSRSICRGHDAYIHDHA